MLFVDAMDLAEDDNREDECQCPHCLAAPLKVLLQSLFVHMLQQMLFIWYFQEMAPSVLTWAEPVVTEPIDASQLAGTGALAQVSKSTQDVIDKYSQQLHVISVQKPSSSQVIRYLDLLDAGFNVSTCDSALIVSTADILHCVAYDKLMSSPNKIGHALEPVSQLSEHSIEHGTSKASPAPLSLQPASQRSEGPSAPCNSRASAPPAQSPATADASATFYLHLPLSLPFRWILLWLQPLVLPLTLPPRGQLLLNWSQPGFSQSMVTVNSVAPEKPSSTVKRSAMGTEEWALMKQSGVDKQEKLMDEINSTTTEYEVKLKSIADVHGYKVAHVKQLALYSSPIKSRCKVLDWNIMMHFKGNKLNKDAGPGHRKTLEEIHVALHEDEELLEIMKDPAQMKEYQEEYYDEKEAESKGKVQRVSSKSMAQAASKTLDLLQSQCDYAYLSSSTNSFSITTCGSFKKDTAKGFFGAGPGDDFLRDQFWINLAKMGKCFDSYVCMKEASEPFVEEITGMKDLVMAYTKYKGNIVAVYKVSINS
ncbi:hypothetical protein BT96DRAFT_999622 [Gymnopus androsaceus JB14]|uniref:Uncharacterized protein n=1 Tax=Gymnopus androsaceus JB14 TaxID=1447944 RepID=A0A6A4H562_9AGAR|nr:hypothetical protein BT96DRAFT_999622 [Gymnopus androsaceus JB14]